MKGMRYILMVVLTLFVSDSWSQNWRDSLDHARQLYKDGHYKQALKYYKSAERLAPNDVDLSEEKGQAAYRAGQYPEAAQAFEHAATHQTDKKRKVTAWNNLGNTRMKQQDYAGAGESFKEALRLDPSNEKARQGLAEAKRQRKKKEEQQQNSENKQSENQQQNGGKSQQQQQGSQQQNKNQETPPSQPKDGKGKSGEQKLADKQTERKLDELMRQESGTKKRLDGSKGTTNGKAAGKDW